MPSPLIIVSTSLICGRGTINHIDNFTICNSPDAARKLKLGTSHRNASKTKKEEREERERVATVEEAEQQQRKWRTHGRRKHWDIEIHLAKGNPKVPVASAAQQVQWKDMASMCVNMYLYIYLYICIYACMFACVYLQHTWSILLAYGKETEAKKLQARILDSHTPKAATIMFKKTSVLIKQS